MVNGGARVSPRSGSTEVRGGGRGGSNRCPSRCPSARAKLTPVLLARAVATPVPVRGCDDTAGGRPRPVVPGPGGRRARRAHRARRRRRPSQRRGELPGRPGRAATTLTSSATAIREAVEEVGLEPERSGCTSWERWTRSGSRSAASGSRRCWPSPSGCRPTGSSRARSAGSWNRRSQPSCRRRAIEIVERAFGERTIRYGAYPVDDVMVWARARRPAGRSWREQTRRRRRLPAWWPIPCAAEAVERAGLARRRGRCQDRQYRARPAGRDGPARRRLDARDRSASPAWTGAARTGPRSPRRPRPRAGRRRLEARSRALPEHAGSRSANSTTIARMGV